MENGPSLLTIVVVFFFLICLIVNRILNRKLDDAKSELVKHQLDMEGKADDDVKERAKREMTIDLSRGLNHAAAKATDVSSSSTHHNRPLKVKEREELKLRAMAAYETPIEEMVGGYLEMPETISVDELRPVLKTAILGKKEISKLPFLQRNNSPVNVTSSTLLQATLMIEDRPLYEEVRDLMAKLEVEAYRSQRDDPYMTKSQRGPLVPTQRLVGQAIVNLHRHPLLQAKVRKVIPHEELADIDQAMEAIRFLYKKDGLVKWTGIDPRVISGFPYS